MGKLFLIFYIYFLETVRSILMWVYCTDMVITDDGRLVLYYGEVTCEIVATIKVGSRHANYPMIYN